MMGPGAGASSLSKMPNREYHDGSTGDKSSRSPGKSGDGSSLQPYERLDAKRGSGRQKRTLTTDDQDRSRQRGGYGGARAPRIDRKYKMLNQRSTKGVDSKLRSSAAVNALKYNTIKDNDSPTRGTKRRYKLNGDSLLEGNDETGLAANGLYRKLKREQQTRLLRR